MSRRLAFAVAAAALGASVGAPAAVAGVDCGPHSRLRSTTSTATGVFYRCVCDSGYVPSSRAIVSAPGGVTLHVPPCVRAGGTARAPRAAPSRRGSYTAEPAREPKGRDTAPPRETGPSQGELGKTAPPAEAAALPPRPEVPVPRPNAASWSDKFPPPNAPAAVGLSTTSFQRIREVPLPSPQWLREKAREKAEGDAWSFAYGQLPLGQAINRLRDLRARFTELGKSQVEEVKEYAVQIFKLQSDTVSCLGSGTTRPQCAQALQQEGIQKKFATEESELKRDWLKQDVSKAVDILRGEGGN